MNTSNFWRRLGYCNFWHWILIIFFLAGCSPQTQPSTSILEPPIPAGTATVQNTSAPENATPTEPTYTPEPSGKGKDIPASFMLAQLDSQPVEVSIEEKNRTTPQDVMREIDFSGGFGGGGNGCEIMENPPVKPTIMEKDEPVSAEWHSPIMILTCGWQMGEKVSVQLIAEDGLIFSEEPADVIINGGIYYYFSPEINTPPGEYQLTFKGEDAVLQKAVTVVVPTSPRFYRIEDGFFLYQFQPDEAVRIFLYQDDFENYDSFILGRLIGWKEFQTNDSGQLKIKINESYFKKNLRTVPIVIGEKSGQLFLTQGLDPLAKTDISLPFDVSVTQPTKAEISQSRSIWEGLNFRDLYQPGTNEYSLTVKPSEKIRWRYNWCAVDKDTLREIMHPFSIKFRINGEELNYIQIAITNAESASGWKCNYWTTLLSNWKENASYVLEIEYVLDEPIFDGKLNYPAGTYRQIINVKVE